MPRPQGSAPASLLDAVPPQCGPFDTVELSPGRRDQILDAFARAVVRRKLQAPAILFLEMHQPLTGLASACVTFSQPTLGAFFGFGRMGEWASLLSDRGNIERLVSRIEELTNGPPTGAAQSESEAPATGTPDPSSPTAEGL